MTTGKTALVTGAASGIGLATATRLAKQGITTLMVDRSVEVEKAARALTDQGREAVGHVLELTDTAVLDAWLKARLDEYGAIDIIVNNAGIHPKKDGVKFLVEEIGMDGWHEVLAVNLHAPFQICATLLPAMKAKGWGRIVNIGSAGARNRPRIPSAHYVTSKAGIAGLTTSIAEEGAAHGITANTVAPGPIKKGLTASSSAAQIERLTQGVPVGRYGTPDEIASMVAFLISEDAAFVTGAVIDVNGGSVMR